MLRVWTCDDHDQFFPVGVASVIVADTAEDARSLLDAALIGKGLKPHAEKPYVLRELNLEEPCAHIICDGMY